MQCQCWFIFLVKKHFLLLADGKKDESLFLQKHSAKLPNDYTQFCFQ